MNYGLNKKLSANFDEAVAKVKESLKNEGFGVLTKIDVKKTLKEKLDIEYENYIIIGACNPLFAYRALQAEKQVGLLLPCNIIVYVQNAQTFVSAINPMEAMGMIDNDELKQVAHEVSSKLKSVIESIN